MFNIIYGQKNHLKKAYHLTIKHIDITKIDEDNLCNLGNVETSI